MEDASVAEVLHLDGGIDPDPDRDFEALARGSSNRASNQEGAVVATGLLIRETRAVRVRWRGIRQRPGVDGG